MKMFATALALVVTIPVLTGGGSAHAAGFFDGGGFIGYHGMAHGGYYSAYGHSFYGCDGWCGSISSYVTWPWYGWPDYYSDYYPPTYFYFSGYPAHPPEGPPADSRYSCDDPQGHPYLQNCNHPFVKGSPEIAAITALTPLPLGAIGRTAIRVEASPGWGKRIARGGGVRAGDLVNQQGGLRRPNAKAPAG